jgi:hypothetical protein
MVMPINGFMRTPPRILKLSTDVMQRAAIRKADRNPDRLLIPLETAVLRSLLDSRFVGIWFFYSIFGEACQRDIQI